MVHCFCSQLDEYPLPRGQSRTNCIHCEKKNGSLGGCVGSSLQVDKVIVGVWNDLGCWSAERFEV